MDERIFTTKTVSQIDTHKFMTLQLKALRVAFFGTSSFAAYHLYILLHCSTHKIVAIFTQEKLCPIKKSSLSILKIATAYKLNLFLFCNLLISDTIHILKQLKVDIIVVISYGLILPQQILTMPKFGCINVHASLLPRWRGAAPIQRAIEYGDTITGISIIQIDSKIDTGNILYTKSCKILETDTSNTLSKRLAQIGSTGLLQTIENIILGTCQIKTQNSLYATYAYKLNKQEARINWKLPAITLERLIRAFNPWPISYFYTNKKRIRIWTAKISQDKYNTNIKHYNPSILLPGTILKTTESGIHVVTGSGTLILITLQISGKRKTPVKDILNAYHKWFVPGSILD